MDLARLREAVPPVTCMTHALFPTVLGFRRFHLRGLAAVQGEWTLVCMAWNLKRMRVAVA